jgi:transposase
MARKHPPYAPEFRRQMIELVRGGRGPEELAKEFEPSAQAIRTGSRRPSVTRAVGRRTARSASGRRADPRPALLAISGLSTTTEP